MNEQIREFLDSIDVNPKIRELAEQSGCSIDRLGFGEGNLEKFAELIVRECADVIRKEVSMKFKDGGETDEFMGGHYAGSVLARVKIKQHFGVDQ